MTQSSTSGQRALPAQGAQDLHHARDCGQPTSPARQGSFAEAGRVLNVTHAAVTHSVRGLEAELGVALVRRTGRTVSLTEAGEALAQALGEGFGTVTQGIETLRQREARRVVRVATTTFIAETHTMPRLPDFWALHSGVAVAMSPSPTTVDLLQEGFDLAIRVMEDGWAEPPRLEIRPLIQSPVLVACALQLAGTDPLELPWLDGPGNAWEKEQVRKAGIDLDRLKTVDVGSPHLAMSAARQGLGVMMAPEIICRSDLATGRLVVLPVKGLPMVTYALVLAKGPQRKAVEQFANWLATIF